MCCQPSRILRVGRAYLRAADGAGFCTPADGVIVQMIYCTDNGRILLANLFQGSRSTLFCVSFPSVFAFQAGMWGTPISALLNSPTVSGRFLAALRHGQSGMLPS